MPTTDNPVFIDTNILVYANLALSPFHSQAVEREHPKCVNLFDFVVRASCPLSIEVESFPAPTTIVFILSLVPKSFKLKL